MTVERAFDLLKGRFVILAERPFFEFQTQVHLVIMCCILHNYISGYGQNDSVIGKEEWLAQILQHMGISQNEIRESYNS